MRQRPLPSTLSLAALGLAAAGTATAFGAPDEKDAQDSIFISASTNHAPGLVHIEGGKTAMGTDKKRIAELLETEAHQGAVRVLDGETPKHTAEIGAFLIGQYEVTNEQYFAFVVATNRRPPEHWGKDALQAAMTEFQRQEQEKWLADNTYKKLKWDEPRMVRYWRENWEECKWAIPEGQELMPVTFVTYDDAEDYCRWAGLRLPTEEEWVHAARGNKDQWFTWGDEWEAVGRAHTTELRRDRQMPVGSFEGGVSALGIHDLVGSVWEWTSSPYSQFDKFKPNKYKIKRAGNRSEELKPEPQFNTAFRIIKGGSYQNGLLPARVSTRQGAKRSQTTAALGFRVAASPMAGRDMAETVWLTEIRNSAARRNAELFFLDGVAGMDRYTLGSAPDGAQRPENYLIIDGYEHFVFAPRDDFALNLGAELSLNSRAAPVVLGFLSTTVPLENPALAPGNYFVCYREKGKVVADPNKDKEKDENAKDEEEAEPISDDTPLELLTPEQRLLRQIDLDAHLLIFTTVETGEYVASIPFDKITKDLKGNKIDPASIEHRKESVWAKDAQGEDVRVQQDWLDISANIRRDSGKRFHPVKFPVQVNSDALGSGWRRN